MPRRVPDPLHLRSALSDAYVRLSSMDQLEVCLARFLPRPRPLMSLQILALTTSHMLHVWLPLPDEPGAQSQVFRAPLPYIKNVRRCSKKHVCCA
eukprot:762497-Hanusia_phi.AAC.12